MLEALRQCGKLQRPVFFYLFYVQLMLAILDISFQLFDLRLHIKSLQPKLVQVGLLLFDRFLVVVNLIGLLLDLLAKLKSFTNPLLIFSNQLFVSSVNLFL